MKRKAASTILDMAVIVMTTVRQPAIVATAVHHATVPSARV